MKKEIINNMGTYILALETNKYIYYVNENECDENANTLMYNKKNELLSNNYFAYSSYMEDMEDIVLNNKKYIYVDSKLLNYAKEYFDI